MIKDALAILALFVLSYPGRAQTTEASPTGDTPENRTVVYSRLNRQIYARHGDAGSGQLNGSDVKFRAAGDQLSKMVSKEIELALAVPKSTASSITASVAKLQGELTLSIYDPDPRFTNTPFAKFLKLNGVEAVAVAYVIMQGGDAIPDTHPYLAFYDHVSGVWQERARAPALSDFEACTFSVAQLNSGVPGEAWFLAWGMPFGSSHGSQHVRLYAFDGAAVRTVWKRDWLDGGRVTTTSDTVTLDYLDYNDPSIERHEVFHVTPNGLLPQ